MKSVLLQNVPCNISENKTCVVRGRVVYNKSMFLTVKNEKGGIAGTPL